LSAVASSVVVAAFYLATDTILPTWWEDSTEVVHIALKNKVTSSADIKTLYHEQQSQQTVERGRAVIKSIHNHNCLVSFVIRWCD